MNHITRLGLLAAAGTVVTLSSCSTGGTSPSGFLPNYAQLNGGYGTADAVSSYLKPNVDFKKYDSVIIDPISTVIATPGISSAVTDQLAADLSSAIHQKMTGSFKIVSAPGPNTLRIRTGLTDVIENQRAGKPVTQIHTNPKTTLTGSLGSGSLAAFISNISFEGELLDSTSGERLVALVDHRLGSKREATATTTWASIKGSIEQGVGRLRDRFKAVAGR